jgi:hypothetical protein
MLLDSNKTYIIKSDEWFPAPDGELYIYVWGKVEIIEAENLLGLVPAKPSTNWYAKVGDVENYVLIAGCKIHSACIAPKPPFNKYHLRCSDHEGKLVWNKQPNYLYIAEGQIKYKKPDYLSEI